VPAALSWTNAGIPLIAALIGAAGGVAGGLWGARIMARSDARLARAERLRALYEPLLGLSMALRASLSAMQGQIPNATQESFDRNFRDVERRRDQCVDAMARIALEGTTKSFGEAMLSFLNAADACADAVAIRPIDPDAIIAASAQLDEASEELHRDMSQELARLDSTHPGEPT
jgi:hypothetical protein